MNELDNQYCYSFPTVRGQQAGRPFYIATCPLRIIPKLFIFSEAEVPPELRAQRSLNKGRIPQIMRYLVDNPKDYVFSALTASVGSDVSFSELDKASDLGILRVPMDTQMLINDGQHRRNAIAAALKQSPELGQDNIAVLFFVDEGLKRSQQIFADLNKHAVRPSPSLGALYDHKDSAAGVARYLSMHIQPFAGHTELEHSSVSLNSTKLFTLNSIKQATQVLLNKKAKDSFSDDELQLACRFWQAVNDNLAEWQMVQNKQLSPSQFRQQYIHAHSIGLQALGLAGRDLLQQHPQGWQHYLQKINGINRINWHKTATVWDNRALYHGKLVKASVNVRLTANVIRLALGLTLSPADQQLEQPFSNP